MSCSGPAMKPSRDIATCKRIMLLWTVSEAKTHRSRGVQMLSSCRPSGQGLAASSLKIGPQVPPVAIGCDGAAGPGCQYWLRGRQSPRAYGEDLLEKIGR